MLFEHCCSIRRHVAVGNNGRRQLADFVNDVACLVLPMSDSTTIRNNFTLGRAYDVYFGPDTDVKAGDQLVFDGDKYTVRSVQPYKVPLVGHVRALCEQEVS